MIVNIKDDTKTVMTLLGIITVEGMIILHQFLLCFAGSN